MVDSVVKLYALDHSVKYLDITPVREREREREGERERGGERERERERERDMSL